jgi:hypothetical protein
VEEVARILVRAKRPGRARRINIMMDEGLIEAIDRLARTGRRSGRCGTDALAARREVAGGGADR